MRCRSVVLIIVLLTSVAALPVLGGSAAGDGWTSVATGGFEPGYNDAQAQASCSVVHGGQLYVGTHNVSGCEVWRYNGSAWTSIMGDGFGDQDNRGAASMASYNGNLYVGTYRQSGACQVWRFNGSAWTRVSDNALEATSCMTVTSMAVYDGKLVVGTLNSTGGCRVLTYDGAAWATETADGWGNASNTAASSMIVFDGSLYVGTSNILQGLEIHAWDGAAWTTAVGLGVPHGFGDVNNQEAGSMAVWNDGASEKLWVGTRNHTDGAEIWSYDPVGIWAMSATGGIDNDHNRSFTTLAAYDDGLNNMLFAGTENTADGCEVYRDFGGWVNVVGSGAGETAYGFGDGANQSAVSMAAFAGSLVVGTSQGQYTPDSGCQVWALTGDTWDQINYNGFAPNSQREVACMATAGQSLYAGTENSTTGGKVWRFSGTSWSVMTIPSFSYHNGRINCMLAQGQNLWIGTANETTGGEVWLYDGSWHCKVGPPGLGEISIGAENPIVSSLAFFGDRLWFGTANAAGCEVWMNDSPGGWSKVADDGIDDADNFSASTMCVYNNALYTGTWRNDGCSVYRYSGGWSKLVGLAAPVGPGFGSQHNDGAVSSAVLGSTLLIGTDNSNSGCEVWAFNGSAWTRSAGGGWGDVDNSSADSMAILSGRLYVGTLKYPNGGEGGEVWMNNGASWRQVNVDGFGDAENNGATALGALGTHIYAGTYNNATGCEVFAGTATPVLTTVSPSSACGGDTVTLGGQNLGTTRGYSYVTVGSQKANEYVLWQDDQVKFKVPPGCAGALPVTVTTSLGTSNAKMLTVTNPVWYLAEGSSDWGFDTYVTIENPNSSEVTAKVTYMTAEGPVSRPELALPAASQTTINPRDDIGAKDFSTKVECVQKKDIAVDRRMVWTGQGAPSPEGHSSIGVTAPAKVWYLPEGSSKWGFECWLLIQNPNSVEATCQITYMIEGGPPKTVNRSVEAGSRMSFNIHDDIGEADASIMVSADHEVIPERAMYRNNRREGHDSIGTVAPDSTFYLAEGTTAWGFTTYVLVQNPNIDDARVTITCMTNDGPVVQPTFMLPAMSRRTVRVNDVMPDKDFSTLVVSDLPIIGERAMYWDNGAGEACHDSIGMSAPHRVFYLPDGETYNGHETFTLVQNPNSVDVTVEVRYLTNGETPNQVFTDTIAAKSRKTYSMAEKMPAGKAAVVVTCKTAGRKVMVERSMYWSGRAAGTDTVGGCAD